MDILRSLEERLNKEVKYVEKMVTERPKWLSMHEIGHSSIDKCYGMCDFAQLLLRPSLYPTVEQMYNEAKDAIVKILEVSENYEGGK